jgi:polar amino acid transport system permease protein
MSFWQIAWALMAGAGYTILVTLACSIAGLSFGLSAALLGRLDWRPLNLVLSVYAYVFRSIPTLVLLFVLFFGLRESAFACHPLHP